MKLDKSWIRVADVLWGVMLVGMLALWIGGEASWYQALYLLVPFGVYLAIRPVLVAATGERPSAPERRTRGGGGSAP